MENNLVKYGWLERSECGSKIEMLRISSLFRQYHNKYSTIDYFLKNKNGFYFIVDDKIYKLKEDFNYNDLESDFNKIELIADNIDEIVKLDLMSDDNIRDKRIYEIIK